MMKRFDAPLSMRSNIPSTGVADRWEVRNEKWAMNNNKSKEMRFMGRMLSRLGLFSAILAKKHDTSKFFVICFIPLHC
jgi:hypothetical protein